MYSGWKKRCLKRESGRRTERWPVGHGEKCCSLLWSSAQRVERKGWVGSAPLLSSKSGNRTCKQSRATSAALVYLSALVSLGLPQAINHPVCEKPAANPPRLHTFINIHLTPNPRSAHHTFRECTWALLDIKQRIELTQTPCWYIHYQIIVSEESRFTFRWRECRWVNQEQSRIHTGQG